LGTSETRRKKLEWLKDALNSFFYKKPDSRISKSRIIAEFAVVNNSTTRTGEELVNLLEQTGIIKINGDEISKAK
jgi:hypothetical protein